MAPIVKLTPRKEQKTGKKRFVLTVGDDGAILLYMQGDKVIRRVFAISPEPSHCVAMMELFKMDSQSPITLLVDIMDQSYVLQSLPPVSSMSIGKIAKRRLDRDFGADDLKGFISLGRSNEKKKDWIYLFASAPNTPPLSDWIKKIIDLNNRLEGIYLLPLELEPVINKLAKAHQSAQKKEKTKPKLSLNMKKESKPTPQQSQEWSVMMSHNKVGGFRQIVLKNGRIIFTRMTQSLGDDAPEVTAGNIEQEYLNTKEYLKRLGFTEGSKIHVAIIVEKEVHEFIDNQRIGATSLQVVSPFQACKLFNLPNASETHDRFADIFLAVAVSQETKKTLRLFTPLSKKLHTLYEAKIKSKIAAMVLCPVCLIFIVHSGIGIFTAKEDLNRLVQDEKNANSRLTLAKKQDVQLPASIDKINNLVDLYSLVQSETDGPFYILQTLQTQVDSKMQVVSLEWNAIDFLRLDDSKSQNPQTAKSRVEFKANLEFTKIGGDADQFLKAADQTLKSLNTKLPEYIVQFSKMPGKFGDNEVYEVTLDNNQQNKQTTPTTASVELTIKGPKPSTNDPSGTPLTPPNKGG